MSAINTGSIDVNYPVPGVNNSSQGFRDNFSGLKSNLDTAASEITELQSKAIFKSALTGIPLNNDMNNTLISNALVKNFRYTTYNLGNNLSGVVTIDLTKGDVQYGTVTGNATLEFAKWAPTGTQSTVELMLTVNSPSILVSLPVAVSMGVSTIENYTTTTTGGTINVLGSMGLDSPSMLHYKFFSIDCGTSITVVPVNRPRKTTQLFTNQVPSSSKGQPGDRKGNICSDLVYVYVCTMDYDSTTDIWKRIPLAGGPW
jgi:hypothetical protein